MPKIKLNKNVLSRLTNGAKTGERDSKGRFVKGNPGGPGNPYAGVAARNRARMFAAITGDDIDLAIRTFREVMKNGKDSDKLAAAKLLLDRAVGTALPLDVIQKLEELEALIAKLEEKNKDEEKWTGYNPTETETDE